MTCLVKNGYPPQYSPEVFNKVMEQVENFEEYSDDDATEKFSANYNPSGDRRLSMVAEHSAPYGSKDSE